MVNTEPGFPDRDPEGHDWLKPGFWDLPTDPDLFFNTVLGGREEMWRHFQTLPVFKAMPMPLRDDMDYRFYGGNKVDRAKAARRSAP